MLYAALPAEIQYRTAVADEGDVTVAKRRESKALVVARVLRIADANAGGVQQADHDGQHFLARQTRQRQVALENAPQLGQLFSKGNHSLELCAVAQFAPLGVIAVLLAPARIP